MTIQDYSDIFLNHCRYEKNLSQKTLKAYRIDLNQFINFLTSKKYSIDMRRIDKSILKEYLQHLVKNNKVKTVKRKIATLKAIFNYLEFEELIQVNPFRKMRIKIKEEKMLPRTLAKQELIDILSTAYKEKNGNKSLYQYKKVVRDITIIEMLFATGLRVSELCSIKKQDIDIISGDIKVTGKGSRERIVQVCNKEVLQILREYAELFHNGDGDYKYFFINRDGNRLSEQSVRIMIKKYVKRMNINKNITPHMFRHTFATMLLEQDIDIRYIQNILGHSSISTTQIYTHVSKRKQKEILMKKHPRSSLFLNILVHDE